MNRHQYHLNDNYLEKIQILNSLVLNPPDKVDNITTSPKISKLLNFPFGIKTTSSILFKYFFQFTISALIFLIIACLLITSLYLPIENQNTKLIKTARTLTNEKYILLGALEELSSYKKLFSSADSFSLKDSQEVINIKSSINNYNKKNQDQTISKYPRILFSGF